MDTWVGPWDGIIDGCDFLSLHGAHEGSGRLNGINVLVEMLGKGPCWGTDDLSSIIMLEGVIFGIQETLGSQNIDLDVDPVLGGAVGSVDDAIGLQPFV